MYNSSFLLSGIIFCECGAKMCGMTRGHKWKYYVCNNRRYKGNIICDLKTVKIQTIEPIIIGRIRDFLKSIDLSTDISHLVQNDRHEKLVQIDDKIKEISFRIKELDKEAKKLLDTFGEEMKNLSYIKNRLTELEKTRDELSRSIEDKNSEKALLKDKRRRLEEMVAFAGDFQENWDKADQASKKEIIRCLVDKITVNKIGTIEMCLTF